MLVQQLRKKLHLDIATVVDNRPQLLTEGFTDEEKKLDEGRAGFGSMQKNCREEGFPAEVIEHGYRIDVCTAQASRDEDKRRILNTINGVDAQHLSDEPDLEHPECEKVNRALRGLFAEAGLNVANRARRATDSLAALAQDTERTALRLDLSTGEQEDTLCLTNVLQSLPMLEQLDINFGGCRKLSDISSIGPGLGQLKSLQQLTMYFYGCDQLSDISSIGQGLGQLKSLQQLTMDFAECDQLSGISSIGQGLGQLQSL